MKDMLCILNKEQLINIFENRKAKYLSQSRSDRHYIIDYKNDGTFTNTTYENNLNLGCSNGIYKLIKNDKNEDIIYIKYHSVFPSPHTISPFNPNNSFFNKLFEGYCIGPFYTKFPENSDILISCFYEHPYNGYKILNFYKKKYNN